MGVNSSELTDKTRARLQALLTRVTQWCENDQQGYDTAISLLVAVRFEIDAVLAAEEGTVDRWICEQHPELDWPHDECDGPGMPLSTQIRALVHQRDACKVCGAECQC